jgi:hypothetical protein
MSQVSAFYPWDPTLSIAVGTSVTTTSLATDNPAGVTQNAECYLFTNSGSNTVYFSWTNASVTTSNGTPVLPNTAQTFKGPALPNATLYTIAAAAGNTLYITPGEGL